MPVGQICTITNRSIPSCWSQSRLILLPKNVDHVDYVGLIIIDEIGKRKEIIFPVKDCCYNGKKNIYRGGGNVHLRSKNNLNLNSNLDQFKGYDLVKFFSYHLKMSVNLRTASKKHLSKEEGWERCRQDKFFSFDTLQISKLKIHQNVLILF